MYTHIYTSVYVYLVIIKQDNYRIHSYKYQPHLLILSMYIYTLYHIMYLHISYVLYTLVCIPQYVQNMHSYT